MSGKIIDGKSIAKKMLQDLQQRVAAISHDTFIPKLVVVLVGEDKPSKLYVRRKKEAAESIGLAFELIHLPEHTSQGVLLQKLYALQEQEEVCGIIVQLPLPPHMETHTIVNAIDASVDVDCLTYASLGRVLVRNNTLVPPTPGAIISILDHLDVSVRGKIVTIVGTGALVGKPAVAMMMNREATVLACNSRTPDLKAMCLQADIIISGVGKKDLITADMVKPGAIVIDAGISYVNKKMYGDVAFDDVLSVAGAVTPTPGGVGPITVSRLLLNTVIIAEKKYKHIQTQQLA